MARTSFTKSILSFNERVVYFGNMNPDEFYTMEELKSKVFFNQIFMENMQEVFQKYPCTDIVNQYIDNVKDYVENLRLITEAMEENDPTIRIERSDSFEQRLVLETQIKDQIITEFYPSLQRVAHRFVNDMIYYLTIMENGYIAVSYVDPRRAIYEKPLFYDFEDYQLYWKTDDSIRDYLKRHFLMDNTVALRITTSLKEEFQITKVEFNGEKRDMERLLPLFPPSALIISNPYIYINDIKQIIDSKMEKRVKVEQEFDVIDFDNLFQKDLLIEYPTTSFDVYLQFLSMAASSDNVESIYLTLYRIGDNPVIYYILKEAVQRGIYVQVNIELFASGERINETWMREMEEVGVNVTTYKAGKIKVHSKLTLIRFNDGRSIAQIGTGNYHSQTTTQYTDLSMMTSDDTICDQIRDVFHLLAGSKKNLSFNEELLVTRYNARKELIKQIEKEGGKGSEGLIVMKCNALDDEMIIQALDTAAKRGCRMNLIIRGVCTWLPDELQETVMIKSIVWDKLEHSRVYSFGAVNPTMYLGSLDLVTNKLDHRIETLVRINDLSVLEQLCDYLNRYIINSKNSWQLTRSGEYIKEVY